MDPIPDGTITEAKLSSSLKNNIINQYATPQNFGAVGNGIHDDTQAIIDCLCSNKIVFVPKGYYRITRTIKTRCSDMTTVFCDKKAVFIADQNFEDDYMFIFSQFSGYSSIGVSWTGGTICCNGVEGLTGFLVNNYCQFGQFSNISIIDVGNNGTGIEVNSTSGKNYFDNINIFGSTFNLGVLNGEPFSIEGNMNIKSYDSTRNNIGFKSINSYDYSIGELYVMYCRVGILSNGCQQVNVGQYHYWIGTDTADTITWADYQQTRGFKSLNTADNWHFDMFYPDKPYIGFEGPFVSADNVHYIAPKNEIISDQTTGLHCYLFLLTNEDGNLVFNNVDINIYGGDRMEYRGGIVKNSQGNIVANSQAYRRKAIKIDFSYQDTFSYITPANCINNSNRAMDINIAGGADYTIGYVCTQIVGSAHFRIASGVNGLTLDFDILSKDYSSTLYNVLNHNASQSFDVYVKLGAPEMINGLKWMPVIIRHGASSIQYCTIEVTGVLPFQPITPVQFTGTIQDSSIGYGNENLAIHTVTTQTSSIAFGAGSSSTVSINSLTIPNGYTIIPTIFGYKGSGTNGDKLIVSNYDSTNNRITVYNPTNSSITSAITIRAMVVRSHT